MSKALLVITFASSLGLAQASQSRFSADQYSRKTDDNKVVLKGNVNIAKDKTLLKADAVELDTQAEYFWATGDVKYNGDKLKITGSKIEGSLISPELKISNGKILSGYDIFEGKRIERIDQRNFFLEQGRYTSCFNSPPDWRLYGNKINVTTEEYAHMEDVVVETFGLPMVYIPYLVLPVKEERQSGFLTPNFGFGTDGFNIHESYFWAINRSNDATFTLGHYGNRGLKEAFEFRSAYADESKGELYYFHINDKKFANIVVDGKKLNEKNRHGFKMDQDFQLGERTYTKNRFRYVSDDNIPRDFPEEMEGRAEPALENRMMITSSTSNISYNADVSYYENLLSRNPLDHNRDQLQRMPELSVNISKTKFSSFMFESDFSYLNVYRTGDPYDDMNANQIFDTGDFVRSGQRFDIYPRLSMPLSNRIFKFTPEIGARYDYYILPKTANAQRTYAEFKAKLSSEISGILHRNEDKQYRSLKHVIEPFVQYNVIPYLQQSKSPFFDAKNGSIEAPGFDSIDKIGKTNTITYGIDNRLLVKYIRNFTSSPIPDRSVYTSCRTCQEPDVELDQEEDEKEKPEEITTLSTKEFLGLRSQANESNAEDNLSEKEETFSILQPIQWKLYQSYNFIDTTGRPFGYLYSDIYAVYEWLNLLLSNFYNVYTKRMGVNSRARLQGRYKYIELGYYNNKTEVNSNIDQLKLQFGFSVWRFGTNVRFILNNALKGKFTDKLQDKYVDITYQPPSKCWLLAVAARAPYDRPGVDVSITFNLLISGQSVGFSPEGKGFLAID